MIFWLYKGFVIMIKLFDLCLEHNFLREKTNNLCFLNGPPHSPIRNTFKITRSPSIQEGSGKALCPARMFWRAFLLRTVHS